MSRIQPLPAVSDPDAVGRSLTLRYIAALALIALLTGGAYLDFIAAARVQEDQAVIINIGGRQRMLSQRIALQATLLEGAEPQTRAARADDLRRTAGLFLASHQALLSGDPALIRLAANPPVDAVLASAAPPPPEIGPLAPALRALYFDGPDSLDDLIRQYAAAAVHLADTEGDPLKGLPALSFVLSHAQVDLLDRLNQVVGELQREGEANAQKLQQIEGAMCATTLVLLLLEAWFIFRPLTRRVRLAFGQLSEQRQAAEAARDVALASERAKSEFLGVIGHELRTPLNGVLGLAQVLLTRPGLAPPDRKLVQLIQDSGDTLLQQIVQIMDYTQYSSATRQPVNEPFDLEQVLGRIEARIRPQIAAKRLSFTLAIDPACPTGLDGPAATLGAALAALADNAVKFTETGGIRLSAAYDRGAQCLIISVSDTGIGVPAPARDRLFRPFGQADQSGSRRHGGLGLGLATAQAALERAGGRIAYAPVPDGGSRFTITLPCQARAPNSPSGPE